MKYVVMRNEEFWKTELSGKELVLERGEDFN
jgi:hypothetical protein